ncbi:protealysin inhibitor emfourin [Arthrobacter sp. TMS1-12-1]
MRIEITRSGGIGGITRTWSLEVSRAEAEQRWLPLAEAEEASGEGFGEGDTDPPAPDAARDRFTYRITVGYTEVSVPESRLAEPWRELIERARAAARSAPEADPGPALDAAPDAAPDAASGAVPGTTPGGATAPGSDGSPGAGHGTPRELL